MASLSEENYNPEEYLLNTLNNLDIGFVKVSNDGTILNHNLTFNKIFGYNPEESLIGTKTLDYWLNPEESNKFRESLYKDGLVKKFIIPAKKLDGEKIFLQLNFKLNKNTTGEIISSEGIFVDVTEHIEAEQKLKESEKRFRTIAENFPNVAIVLYDHDLRYLLAEGEVIEKVGLTSEKMVGNNLRDLVTDEYYNALAPHYKAALNGETHRFEFEFRGIIFDTSTLPIKDSDGNIIAGMSISQDITERKKIEQKLKESEEKWRSMTKNSPDFIFTLDKEERFTSINKIEVLRLELEGVIGKSLYDFIPKKDHKLAKQCFKRVFKSSQNDRYYSDFVYDDGTIHYFENRVGAILNEGNVVGFAVSSTDITERKKTEEELRLQSEIMTNMSEGVYLVRMEDLIIAYANPRFEEMFGYTRGEMIGKDVAIVNAPTDKTPDEIKNGIVGILKDTGEWHGEVLNIKKDGTSFWCYANVSVFDHPEYGRVLVSIHSDITERKKKEEEIELHSIIMTNLAEGVHLIRADDGKIVYTNPAFEEMFGYTGGEMIGKDISIVNAPTDKAPEETKEEILGILLETREWHGEINNIKKDGTTFWCYANVSLFDHPEYGKVNVAVHTDITERKKAEEKLKESEEKWRALSENSPAHILLLDREHKIIFINRTVPDLSKEEVIGTSVFNYTPQEFHKAKRDCFNSVWETGEPSSFHQYYKTKEGDIRFFDIWVGPVFQSGKVVALVAHSMDITDRKKKEEEIRLQSEIIENMSEGVHLIRVDDGIIVYTNPAFEGMFGYNPGEMIGKDISIVNAPTDKTPEETKEEIIGILLETGKWHGEVLNIKKDGTTYWCYANVSLFEHPEHGKVIVAVHTDITERKKAEQKLNESEHILGERVKELTCLYGLSKLLEIQEISQEAILRGVLDLIPPAWQIPEITCARINFDNKEYKTSNFKETEWKLSTNINVHEKVMIIEVYYLEDKPFLKEEEHLINDLGKRLKSIIEQRETQQKLKESEEKYRMLFESSTDGIASVDMEGRIIDVNNVYLKMLGYSKEELLRLNFRDITPQKWHEMEDNLIASQLSGASDSVIYEKEYIKKDGTILPINARFWIIKDVQGDPVRIWGIVRDISDQKKKEKEIFDLAQFPSEDPYPILRVNRNGVMYINEAGQNLLNLKDNDQIPKIFQENVKVTFESNQITEFEIELDGRNYSFTITPVKDADYVNIYGMDITERKHVEEKLKEVNKLKSEFLRRASHELKTPLISIKGFSDLILSLYANQLDTPIISKLREINDGCERLQNIINNLLKTSRLESPDLKPKVQKEDLSFLIKFCVNELQPLAERRKQSIKLDILNELYANMEKEEIHDVLSNLLTNAIKYTLPMGKIEVKTELKEDSVVVSVSDNGIGFTEEQKTKIFQQFGKIERYGQGLDLGIGGTGLGLYISKRIVESHGGEIWMESAGKNKGSSFYFTLPTAK